jgi:hypothetical protein
MRWPWRKCCSSAPEVALIVVLTPHLLIAVFLHHSRTSVRRPRRERFEGSSADSNAGWHFRRSRLRTTTASSPAEFEIPSSSIVAATLRIGMSGNVLDSAIRVRRKPGCCGRLTIKERVT